MTPAAHFSPQTEKTFALEGPRIDFQRPGRVRIPPPEKPVAPTNERESESPYHPHERHGLPTSSIRSGLECPAAAFVDKHFERATAGHEKSHASRGRKELTIEE